MIEYGITSRDYLTRAEARLEENTPEGLFYAALELRFGIEARMQEYLEAQEDVSKKKKAGWQIAKLGKDIEHIFKLGDKVAEFTIMDKDTGSVIETLYYTPVTSSLRKHGERLGDLLHSLRTHAQLNDQWWTKTRATLEDTLKGLKRATTGTLLGVPLMKKATGQLSMNIEVLKGEDSASKRDRIGRTGVQLTLRVQYLNDLPRSADV